MDKVKALKLTQKKHLQPNMPIDCAKPEQWRPIVCAKPEQRRPQAVDKKLRRSQRKSEGIKGKIGGDLK